MSVGFSIFIGFAKNVWEFAALIPRLYVPSANAYPGPAETTPPAHLLENGRARARRPEAGTVYCPGHFHRNEKPAATFHYAAWHKDGATALRFAARIAPTACQAYSVSLRRGSCSPSLADALRAQQRARRAKTASWHFCCEALRAR